MSRIGSRIIKVPETVTVTNNNRIIEVKGPKGTLTQKLAKNIELKQEGNEITLTAKNEEANAMHGTMNALITNMITGVTSGFEKKLQITGVGYRFNAQGSKLVISAGYSHPVEMQVPAGLTIEVKDNTELSVRGISKEEVGEFAANVRKVRQPEPYKGKGIRYKDEHIIRKEGKKAA